MAEVPDNIGAPSGPSAGTPPVPTARESAYHRNERKPTISFNPLAPYKGVWRRFVLLYKHVLALMAGAHIARVDRLPEYRKKFLRSAGARFLAFLLRPLVKKELRSQPFEVQLRRRLEMLGPTYVKLGQIMAIREDILPKHITDELSKLLDRLPEVPFHVIKEIIEQNLGVPVEELFSEIQEEPLGSASIGQTHLAKTHSGETVVLKIIKPGIREAILSDLKLLKILANFLEWLIPRYQPKMIIHEFCRYTEKEIDLTYEADHAELFAANFADHPDIVFPKIYRELSTEDVLCMEYIDGIKPNDPRIFELYEEHIPRIIDLGAEAIIKMLYEDGFFHADLHAGNLLVLPGPKVGFIDLGMVGRFEEKIKAHLLYYFHALVNGDVENTAKHLLAIARVGKDGDPEGFRRAVSDLFRRYLLQARRGNFSLAQLILESLAIGGEHRIFFPVEMTLMVKALVTFEGVGQHLDPRLSVPDLSRKHITRIYQSRYHPDRLVEQLMQGVPELIDVVVHLPRLITDGARALDQFLNQGPQENPLVGLRSSLMAGACIVAGVIAVVQGGHPLLWIGLFVSSVIFFFFGK
ncbi:MAG: AarF/ABC1/UbiB kinase family protein [Calditrichaeota bacterium]|nr:MAG: AarF/ABC1/UbiB kinase family protein [Calditrichota bacterium]